MKSISLFNTLIYHQKLTKNLNPLNANLLQEVEVLLVDDHKGRQWSHKNYPVGYTSYGSLDQMFNVSPHFAKLRKEIDKHINRYLQDLDYDCSLKDLCMNTMWVNVMPKGAYHTMHIHPQSVISGTYYLQIPQGSSCIKFEDPRWSSFMNSPRKKTKAQTYNQLFFEVLPKEGDLVFFESWLRHEVPQNKSKDPRISISFNYDWKKQSCD